MIKNVWSVLCEGSSVDKDTGRVSLFNTVENLKIFPVEGSLLENKLTVDVRLQIVSLWARENPEEPAVGSVRLMFCDPSDVCKNRLEIEVDLATNFYHRSIIKIQSIELNGPGLYKFLLELKESESDRWAPVTTLPLMVVYSTP